MDFFRTFWSDFSFSSSSMPIPGFIDLLDILIVAYLIYKIIFWIKETRAWVLFKGIMVIFAFTAVAVIFKLNTILWTLSKTISVGIIAVIVVFQPELRRALEQLGKGTFIMSLFKFENNEGGEKENVKTVEEIVTVLPNYLVKAIEYVTTNIEGI